MSVRSQSPINREFLATMCDDDEEFAKELVEAFLTAAPGMIDQIRTGVSSADPDVVRAGAHTLKGSSRAIGAEPIGELCETLEVQARQADLTGAIDLVQEVEARFAEVDAYARSQWSGLA